MQGLSRSCLCSWAGRGRSTRHARAGELRVEEGEVWFGPWHTRPRFWWGLHLRQRAELTFRIDDLSEVPEGTAMKLYGLSELDTYTVLPWRR